MKKLIALCLAAVLLCSLFACGKGGETLRREKMTQAEAEWIPAEQDTVVLETALGTMRGIQREGYREFRGISYATAERWEQAVPVTGWEGVYDATRWETAAPSIKDFTQLRTAWSASSMTMRRSSSSRHSTAKTG